MRTIFAAIVFLCLAAQAVPGADAPMDAGRFWAQWRGPDGSGVAPQADPPLTWGEDHNIKWKIALPGKGHATPVIWGDLVFVVAAIETDREGQSAGRSARGGRGRSTRGRGRGRGRGGWMRGVSTTKILKFELLAINRADGSIAWQQTAAEELPHEGTHADGSWASNSPVTDGEHIFAYFGSRGLYCYDMQGNPQWERNLGRLSIKMGFGEGSSPVLCDDKIIVVADHEGDSTITALDKRTGKQRWKVDRDEGTAWATPLVVKVNGKAQIIVSATNRVRAYDPDDGKVIWECGGMTRNVIPSPVAANGLVYVASGFRGNALRAIRLSAARGDITDTAAVVWSSNRDTPYTPSPLLYGNSLYLLKANTAVLTCLDATDGSAHYRAQRLDGVKGVYASPVGAADRVYIVGRNGVTQVLQRGPRYKVLAQNALNDQFTASPVVAGQEIYLRGHKSLYCIAVD